MKAYWKASLISEAAIVGIFAVPRGPKWEKISLRDMHHAHSSPHPPNASCQNQRHDTDKAPVEAFTTTHHREQLENLSHGEEWEQAASVLLRLLFSGSLTKPMFSSFQGHTAGLSDNQFYIHTHVKDKTLVANLFQISVFYWKKF